MNFYVCYVVDLCWDMKVVGNVTTSIYCSFFLENISCNFKHLMKSYITNINWIFLEHIPTMTNNYLLWLSIFLLRSSQESISHDLTNEENGLHILSLIWHLIPCFNLLFLTLDVIAILHIFAWSYYLIVLCLFPSIIFIGFFWIFAHCINNNPIYVNPNASSNMIFMYS